MPQASVIERRSPCASSPEDGERLELDALSALNNDLMHSQRELQRQLRQREVELAAALDEVRRVRAATAARERCLNTSRHQLGASNAALRRCVLTAAHGLRVPTRNLGVVARRFHGRYAAFLDREATQWLQLLTTNAALIEQLVVDFAGHATIQNVALGVGQDIARNLGHDVVAQESPSDLPVPAAAHD